MPTDGPWRVLQINPNVSRRDFLIRGGLAGILLSHRPPAAHAAKSARPICTHGVSTGDPSPDGVIVWARADRNARMRVEWSADPIFRSKTTIMGTQAHEMNDFTARARLVELPPGKHVFYRVFFDGGGKYQTSRPAFGQFKVPSTRPVQDYRFLWSGDVCGQGFGINPDVGGLRIFDVMRAQRPDVFLHCGDVVYVDGPLRRAKRLSDGRVWRNIVTPEKRKVAETMAEFHGNYRYNLLDENVRRFNQSVPQIVLWDDHETKNNWWPGAKLSDARYVVKDGELLARRARKAFFDYVPMTWNRTAGSRIYRQLPQGPLVEFFALDGRSYRGPNSMNQQEVDSPQSAFFGRSQCEWLLRRLDASTALWKVIATPQPLSALITHHGGGYDGIGNGQATRPLGRELELARLLRGMKQQRIRNCIWVTADVHYAAALRYEPERAVFKDFNGFLGISCWSTQCSTFGPNPLDATFGPKAQFVAVPRGMKQGLHHSTVTSFLDAATLTIRPAK